MTGKTQGSKGGGKGHSQQRDWLVQKFWIGWDLDCLKSLKTAGSKEEDGVKDECRGFVKEEFRFYSQCSGKPLENSNKAEMF